MDELQQAIAIAEAGNSKEAQMRLARYLKREPDSVEGWLALSRVVSDRKKKRVFLNKILTLEPQHALARSQLAALDLPTVTPDMPTVIETNNPEPPPGFDALDEPPAEPSAAAAPVNVSAAAPAEAAEEGAISGQAGGGAEDPGADAGSPSAADGDSPPQFKLAADRVEPVSGMAALSAEPEDSGSTDWLLVGLGGLAIVVGLILIFLLLQFF